MHSGKGRLSARENRGRICPNLVALESEFEALEKEAWRTAKAPPVTPSTQHTHARTQRHTLGPCWLGRIC